MRRDEETGESMRLGEDLKQAGTDEGAEGRLSVRVLFFGAAREAATDEISLTFVHGTTAREAFERLLDEYPDLRRFRSSLLVAVNQEYARDLEVDWELRMADLADGLSVKRRQERVKCHVEKQGRKWPITSFAPLSLFAP